MNEEPKLNIETQIDKITDIGDFNIYALNRIHDPSIETFRLNFTGVYPDVIWEYAKLNFQNFDTSELTDSFVALTSAMANVINNNSGMSGHSQHLNQLRQNLQTRELHEHFDNTELAEAILNGQASEQTVATASLFSLQQYISDAKNFTPAAYTDYHKRVLPALTKSLAEQSTTEI